MKVERSETKSGLSSKHKSSSKNVDGDLFSRLLGLGGLSPTEKKKDVEFNEINNISGVITPESREELNELADEIDKAGKEFVEKPLYANLVKYKMLIQRFMGIVIKSSYEVQQKLGKKSLTEDKMYSVVKKIDKELEQLSESVLNKNIDKIKLIDKLDEIRGLLIDLYK